MATEHRISLQVNGTDHALDVLAATLLVDLLRETLGLTGTHVGCDTGQCGACTVLLDGRAVKACSVLALQADGTRVQTIEGLSPGAAAGTADGWHPMQLAFSRHHGLQCGYCTPGMVMRAVAMEAEGVPAEAQAVRDALEGNLCRCTGYQGIVDAICDGLACMRAPAGA